MGLLLECPEHVLARHLRLAERVRIEERIRGVESRNGVDVGSGPSAGPDICPALGGSPGVYFATSIDRDSRMTMTFTWPGYSS